jgi:hypothetical protein
VRLGDCCLDWDTFEKHEGDVVMLMLDWNVATLPRKVMSERSGGDIASAERRWKIEYYNY